VQCRHFRLCDIANVQDNAGCGVSRANIYWQYANMRDSVHPVTSRIAHTYGTSLVSHYCMLCIDVDNVSLIRNWTEPILLLTWLLFFWLGQRSSKMPKAPSFQIGSGRKFGGIVVQINRHRLTARISDMMSYFQDGSHDVRAPLTAYNDLTRARR